MNILVLNCGSSSVKFQLIQTDYDMINANTDKTLASGLIERIGSEALITFKNMSVSPAKVQRSAAPIRDHQAAISFVIEWLISKESGVQGVGGISDIQAIGHRVVHGGEKLTASTVIDDHVIDQIEDCNELAPLHNPQNLKGIYATQHLFGASVPQVAVFDTAFHHTMPEHAYLYAIPYQFYRRHKIRRYGFHGISHRYVSFRYRTLMNIERDTVRLISIHLGNGCSACAIEGGCSTDTSMGMTPLEGLVMGTRSGDIDAAVLAYLAHKEGLSFDEAERVMNKQSGLLGISGLTNDMRDLIAEAEENNDRRAKLAIDVFCYRVKKYIGAYLAALNGAMAIAFTGGIGENAAFIRKKICSDLDWLGVRLDEAENHKMVGGKEGKFSMPDSRLALWVIPTNEELIIARDTFRALVTETA
ncbi:MAG: acetate kinase [[Candidatus Thermochlorobacteriaceae] bacterium GBChlB]|nr:MAG: acetate kinase [[Candidatus Thermochlorobacteriaceae] bacterium GBChlB]